MLGCPGAEPWLSPVQGWFWFVELNATFAAGTAALQEAEPSCLLGVLGQASWEEKLSVCPQASPLPCLPPLCRCSDCRMSCVWAPWIHARLSGGCSVVFTCTAICIHLQRGYLPASQAATSSWAGAGSRALTGRAPPLSISPGPS